MKTIENSVAVLFVLVFVVFSSIGFSQNKKGDNSQNSGGGIERLVFEPTMESLKQYTVHEWFQDAKFGIWAHWRPQGSTDIPYAIDNGWYARMMYEPGNPVYEWHVKNFGHPSVFGYKDIIKHWNPSKFSAHHDNFDMWDSKYQPRWNAKATNGKDIVGLWHDAAKKNGLKFGVSSHVARTYQWFQTSHGSDAGGKYDGQDPANADLYGVPWKDSNGLKIIMPSSAPESHYAFSLKIAVRNL